ncbi:hypothetical protein JCGZ_07146 [Jatropha curcas]|uniref:Uncharacterized protein n=1 Tax=Jatropha curcas TaxID=180498 RepID=A0A067KMQ9_JATCU|nr:hypothetical protein JCGZ_07146 [Jatropha curcas]
MAVHKHAAASKSTKPLSKAQHLLPDGGLPIGVSPSKPAQTPSFNVSSGQDAAGGGAAGVGLGLQLQQSVETENAEKKRRERTKTKAKTLLEAIALIQELIAIISDMGF